MKNKSKSILFASIAVLFWSTVPTAFKLGLKEYTPIQLILIASFVSVLILGTVLVFQGKSKLLLKQSKKEFTSSLLLGAFNPFIYYIILFKAYSLLPAQLAQPLNMIWPIVISILSVPLLGQRISWKSFVALAISFVGVIIISSQGGINGFQNTNIPGVLLALVSSIMWALYWILNVKDKRDEILKLFQNFVVGFILLLIATAIFSDFHFQWGTGLWAAVYIGFFEVGVTYILWMNAMKFSQNNAIIGNLVFFAPFISLLFVSLILKEEIYFTTFIGIIFILGGVLFQQIKKRKIS